jgi:glycosyltransferase involved in cell wall biosynthesis
MEQLRIGMIAPPLVAPTTEHNIETTTVVSTLIEGLTERGHEVVVAHDDDRTLQSLGDADVIHDHTLVGPRLGGVALLAPLVVTCHGSIPSDLARSYGRLREDVALIATSRDQAAAAPPGVEVEAVIPHGLDLERYHFDPAGGGYLLSIGRILPDSGLDLAIDAARRVGVPLLISGRLRTPLERQYFRTQIRPLLGRGIEYVGDLDHGTRTELLSGALALLCPARRTPALGLLPVEALACGTPVICRPIGAAPDIIEHGVTGFVADTMGDLARAVRRVEQLDRHQCRSAAEARFSIQHTAADHEHAYRRLIARSRRHPGELVGAIT